MWARRALKVAAILAAVALAAVVPRAAGAAKQRVAILGVEPQDDGDPASQRKTAALAKALTDAMRAQVNSGATDYELATNSSKELTELKLLSDCLDESTACMAAIGGGLGADVLVFGHLQKKRGDYIVAVTSLQVSNKAPGPLSISRAIPVGEATEELMQKVGADLFGPGAAPPVPPSPKSTTLAIETNVQTGTVYVNGAAVAQVVNGSASIKGLPEGPIEISIDSPGYVKSNGRAMIRAGTPIHFKVELDKVRPERGRAIGPEIPLPPPHSEARPGGTARVLFWTSLVLTAGGVAAFTITGLQVKSIEDEQDQAIAQWGDQFKLNGVQHPNDACAEAQSDGYAKLIDICDRGRNMATLTNVLIGATAVTAVATVYFLWKGYLSSAPQRRDEGPTARARRQAPERSILVTPEVYRGGGGGVGAVIQF